MPGRLHLRQPTLHSPQALITREKDRGQKHCTALSHKIPHHLDPTTSEAQGFPNRNSRSNVRSFDDISHLNFTLITVQKQHYKSTAEATLQKHSMYRSNEIPHTSTHQRHTTHRGYSTKTASGVCSPAPAALESVRLATDKVSSVRLMPISRNRSLRASATDLFRGSTTCTP
jgi:hypothetical protein